MLAFNFVSDFSFLNVWVQLFRFTIKVSDDVNEHCVVRQELDKSKVCIVTLRQMYQVSQTFDLVWWGDIVTLRFCNTLVQSWVTVCGTKFNSNTSALSPASVMLRPASWPLWYSYKLSYLSVCGASHMSARTSGSFVPFASQQSSFLTHFDLSECWSRFSQFLFLGLGWFCHNSFLVFLCRLKVWPGAGFHF